VDTIEYTDVPRTKIPDLLSLRNVWQQRLIVWAALADAQAGLGLISSEAARAIRDAAIIERLDLTRVEAGVHRLNHPLMALLIEFRAVVGEHGQHVHVGATTDNIVRTADSLVLRQIHGEILELLAAAFEAMAKLAEESKDMLCAARTHRQHGVPMTFGLKVAGWIAEFEDHIERLAEIEPRAFTVMMGGAVGHYGSWGAMGPQIQAEVADLLDLYPARVPSRAIIGVGKAEYLNILGLIAATCFRVFQELETLMGTEYGEVCEPIRPNAIGSSIMPQKVNPTLADRGMSLAAQLNNLTSLGTASIMTQVHEVSNVGTRLSSAGLTQGTELAGEMLSVLVTLLSGLRLFPKRMRTNLDLTGGLISAADVTSALEGHIGLPKAHGILHEIAQKVQAGEGSFARLLASDSRIESYLTPDDITRLLDPAAHVGLSVEMSEEAAVTAHRLAANIRRQQAV